MKQKQTIPDMNFYLVPFLSLQILSRRLTPAGQTYTYVSICGQLGTCSLEIETTKSQHGPSKLSRLTAASKDGHKLLWSR